MISPLCLEADLCLISSRFETCYQIALAIKKEVEDLEAAGIQVGTAFQQVYLYAQFMVAHNISSLFFAGHPN
jgi:ABC-type uncharacterized transport system YnjBCD ATPase subunit